MMPTMELDTQQHQHQPQPPPTHHHQFPVPPPQFQRVTSCDRHPDQPVTGFCASCLRERLAGLNPKSTIRRPNNTSSSTTSSALKSIFFRPPNPNRPSSSSSSFLPELRRCKSFSCARADGSLGPPAATSFEPQRRSCDVRGRSTLWSLFHQDDHHRQDPTTFPLPSSSSAIPAADLDLHSGPIVVEEEEEEEDDDDDDEEFQEAPTVAEPELEEPYKKEVDEDDEIRTVEEVEEEEELPPKVKVPVEVGLEAEVEEEAVRPMKEHIDLEAKKPPAKDLKEIAGSFWLAASVFSKKLQKWRQKQKLKKQNLKASSAAMQMQKPSSKSRRFRETQSEVAVDAFGRRSCDMDPRFSLDAGRMSLDAGRMSLDAGRMSLDAGRMSFDDPRHSWDEPRASWDGYLVGGRSVFPRLPTMLSVVEDAPLPTVQRSDGLIPVEDDQTTPGGTSQTRDYYSDSLQRRRKSLDRSSSVRRPALLVEEEEEPKPAPIAHAKVSPAGNEFFQHVNKLEREFRDSNSNSLRDDRSESFESVYREPVKGCPPPTKKSLRWSKAWNIWGFIHRRSNGRRVGRNGVERSLSESWPELRREAYNGRVMRSNSSVSSRHPLNGSTAFGSMRRSGFEINGHNGMKKRREEFVLERNRSARYSPGHLDNGLLRFYLTPMRSSRRGGSSGGRHKSSHSFTRSVLRLY